MPGCGGWRACLRAVQGLSQLLPAGPDETRFSRKRFSPQWTTEQGPPVPGVRSLHVRGCFLWLSIRGSQPAGRRGSWRQHTGTGVLTLHLLQVPASRPRSTALPEAVEGARRALRDAYEHALYGI